MNCKFCENELPVGSNPRRLFCNDAHKMKWHRQQQQEDQHAALLAELEELRAKVTEQARIIEKQAQELRSLEYHYKMARQLQDDTSEQAAEITRLKHLLDIERRYLEDTKPRTFKAWLKKQPSSPWRIRVLNDQTFPARGSRALYEAHIRRLCTDPEERDDFVRLWKLMLTERS